MKENQASLTALMSAFARAYHAENVKNPVFGDTVAKKLLSEEEYIRISNYIIGGIDFFAPEKKESFTEGEQILRYLVNTQLAPTPLARAEYCEESLKTAMLTGTEQYVVLGAGLDTFAFREPAFMEKYDVYEVDHPLTQSDKKKRIARAGLSVPDRLHFVPTDFSAEDLKEKLLNAGFDPNRKTFFSCLGVVYYLSAEQIEKTLKSISELCAEGSTLLFDYADEGLFDSKIKRVQNMLATAAAGGEPMKSCFAYPALEKILEKYNFLIYELLTPTDIQSRCFNGREKGLTAFEHVNYALTVFKRL